MHCSAGIHRTGSVGYSLLRLGAALSQAEAYLALKTLREDTHSGVCDWRIAIVEEHVASHILENRAEDPSIPDDQPAGIQKNGADVVV